MKKKLLFIIGGLVLITGIIGGYFGYQYYKYEKARQEEERRRRIGVEIFTHSEQEIEEAKSKITLGGKVKEIKDKTIILEPAHPESVNLFLELGAKSTENPEIEITVDENTKIQKGLKLEKGSLTDLTPGKQIQVLINKNNKKVFSIWYEN